MAIERMLEYVDECLEANKKEQDMAYCGRIYESVCKRINKAEVHILQTLKLMRKLQDNSLKAITGEDKLDHPTPDGVRILLEDVIREYTEAHALYNEIKATMGKHYN